MAPNIFFYYLLVGELGVSNMILWGVYGDLLAEKFSQIKVLRSLLLGGIVAIFLYLLDTNTPLFVVALTTITFERFSTEVYKAFLREEKQNKYLIPSDWNIRLPGFLKKIIGFALILLFFLFFKNFTSSLNKLLIAALAGFVAALAGAAKDAPYEGFQLKFFRSPTVAIGAGLFINYFYPNLASNYYLFCVWGGERIVSEFYKKIVKGRIPGKFKSFRLNEEWRRSRVKLLAFYFLDLSLLLALLL